MERLWDVWGFKESAVICNLFKFWGDFYSTAFAYRHHSTYGLGATCSLKQYQTLTYFIFSIGTPFATEKT